MKHAKNIRMDRKTWNRENVMSAIYRLFWIYVICGVAGFVIETVCAGSIFRSLPAGQAICSFRSTVSGE